jgi:hypothetical protein
LGSVSTGGASQLLSLTARYRREAGLVIKVDPSSQRRRLCSTVMRPDKRAQLLLWLEGSTLITKPASRRYLAEARLTLKVQKHEIYCPLGVGVHGRVYDSQQSQLCLGMGSVQPALEALSPNHVDTHCGILQDLVVRVEGLVRLIPVDLLERLI